MRDLLTDLDQGALSEDPVDRARAAQRPSLPKRFYTQVSVGEGQGADGTHGFTILLDGRPVRTPARSLLLVPSRKLADAMAVEWSAQKDVIDPFSMPLTRLVNVALDRVSVETEAVREDVVRYVGTDMLFYRAEGPQSLVDRQARHWDGVLDWLRDQHGARFYLAEGIRHVAQPDESLQKMRGLVPSSVLELAAVHSITSLTGSALLALAVAQGHLDGQTAWRAAHVDEDWNRDQWGEDELATERRLAREAEMNAAVHLLALLEQDD